MAAVSVSNPLAYWLKVSYAAQEGQARPEYPEDHIQVAILMHDYVMSHHSSQSLKMLGLWWELAYYKFAPGLTTFEKSWGFQGVIDKSLYSSEVAAAHLWTVAHKAAGELRQANDYGK